MAGKHNASSNPGKSNADKLIPIPIEFGPLKGTKLANSQARCGMCKHYSHIPHTSYGNTCNKKGITEFNMPCKEFSPDVWQINPKEDKMDELINFVGNASKSKLPILAALLMQEALTRKHGFHMGMEVYVKVFGADYLSSYFKGKIYSADSKQVYIKLDCGGVAVIPKTSVIKDEKFKTIRRKLLAENRKLDPNFKSYFRHNPSIVDKKKKALAEGEVLTLDNAESKFAKSITISKNKPKSIRVMPLDKILAEKSPVATPRSFVTR